MQHTPLETVDLCREASDALAGASDASRAVVLAAWAAAHCATYTGQLADVVRLFRDAIAIAEGVDDADVRRTVFGYAYESGVAEYPGLVASHLRAEYVAACSRSSSPVVQAWGELASCAEPPDPAEDPTDAYRRGLEKVDRVGDTAARTFQVDLLAHTEYTRAGLMLRAGDLDALNDRLFPSEASPEPVERLARRFGLTAHRIGELLYHRDELRLVVASTRELANEAPTRTMLLNWYGGHALGLADSGDADAATEVLDDISADELVDLAVGGTTVFAWLIEAAWSVGHRATLEGCLPRFDGAGAAEAGVALHGTPGMWRALAHWGLGRIDAADEQFEVGRAHCDELGLVLFANIADAYRARLWFEHDLAPIDDVIALADRARRSAREHGQHRVTRILAEVPSADGS